MQHRFYSWFLSAGLLSAALIATYSPARADEWDKRTVITFNEPVEIPGMVLPAGTYVMKLADDEYNRDVVEFFNQNESHLYDTVLAIAAYRATPSDKTVIRFEERTAGAPQAVKVWYYPGDLRGEELLYKKPKAIATHEMASVATAPPQPTPPQPTQQNSQPAPAPQPQTAAAAPPPVETAQAQAPPAAPNPAPASAPAASLPKTASDLPLVGLLGLGLLAAGTLVSFLNRELIGLSR